MDYHTFLIFSMATQLFGCCFLLQTKDFLLHLYLIVCFPIKARAGVEMALIDAVANSIRIPLWRLFGGASDTVTTDITVYAHPIIPCLYSKNL